MLARPEPTLASLIQRVDHPVQGKHRGLVVDNDDPDKLGRLKLRVPGPLGDSVVTGWALPCLPFGGLPNQGQLFVPEVGAAVWVEFEGGNPQYPIWLGTYFGKPSGETEAPKANGVDGNETEVLGPPTRKIIKSSKGHTIQLEDKDGEELVLIVQRGASEHARNVIALNADGIAITQHLDQSKKNSVVLGATGIVLEDFTQNRIEMSDSAFKITAKVAFSLDAPGQSVTITASSIDMKSG